MIPVQASGLRDSLVQQGEATAYDTVWSAGQQLHESGTFERLMLADDKLYVVLAVVLIIWFGLIFMILKTDRKIRTLERTLETRHSMPIRKKTADEA